VLKTFVLLEISVSDNSYSVITHGLHSGSHAIFHLPL